MINYKKIIQSVKFGLPRLKSFSQLKVFSMTAPNILRLTFSPQLNFFFFAIEKEKLYMSSGQNR